MFNFVKISILSLLFIQSTFQAQNYYLATDLFSVGEEVSDENFGNGQFAGDLNGDYFDDLIIGAHLNDENGIDAGKVYLYYGSPSMNNTFDLEILGENPGDNFGISVSKAGDLNDDGVFDFVVGANGNDENGDGAGKVYIYYGNSVMDNIPDVTILGPGSYANFGCSVANAGDFNNDGYDDIIIGASGANRAYLYYGGNPMNPNDYIEIFGEVGNDSFGKAVAFGGDLNNDGFDDILISDPYFGGWQAGKAYVYFGNSEEDNNPDLTMSASTFAGFFAVAIGSAGDFNKDDFDDIVITSRVDDYHSPGGNRAFVYFGGTNMDNIPDVVMHGEYGGEHTGDDYGSSVSGGDINNDGFDDLIVGAEGYSGLGLGGDIGRSYIYFGNSIEDNNPDLVIIGEGFNTLFGCTVASAGDINNDGFDELLISNARSVDDSKVYLFDYKEAIPFFNLDVFPNFITIGSESKSVGESRVYSNINWVTFDHYDWLKVDPDDGENNGNLKFIARTENPSETVARKAVAYISNLDQSVVKEVTITQSNEVSALNLSEDEILIGAGEGSITEFDVSSNISWKTYDYASWLKVDPDFGEGDGKILLTALSENSSSADVRSDTVYIQAGGLIKKVIVRQNTLVDIKSTFKELPKKYSLLQNYPNPFNPASEINYSIVKPSRVSLKVYDILGKDVLELVNENQGTGNYKVSVEAGQLPSGIYFYRLQAGDFVETKKMILLK